MQGCVAVGGGSNGCKAGGRPGLLEKVFVNPGPELLGSR